MNLIKRLFSPNPQTPPDLSCPHGPAKKKFTITVLGRQCTFKKSPLCPSCTSDYLNRHSTICYYCGEPIFPGDAVAIVAIGSQHPYAHLSTRCSDGSTYAGHWGEGKFEPNPDFANTNPN